MGKAWFTDYPHISTEFENLKIIDNPFVKGWWTNHKDEPIKRAIYGQRLRFYIEMDKSIASKGDVIEFKLFDRDIEEGGADDYITIKCLNCPNEMALVGNDSRVVIDFIIDEDLSKRTNKTDKDCLYELYFSCKHPLSGDSYFDLPKKKNNYLNLGNLVIDRYKMPGLNAKGTGIADDMTYGFGKIYPKEEKDKDFYYIEDLNKFKEDYKNSGYNHKKHRYFSNEINKKDNYIIEDPKPNYTKEQCYSTFYNPKFKIPLINLKLPPISTGLDTKVFDNFSDEFLFWNFKNTAELYFARVELQGNLDRMIAKFKKNEGGVYEDKVLTKNVKDHPNTLAYCQKVENYIENQLRNNFKELGKVEDKEPYFIKVERKKKFFSNKIRGERKKNFNKPKFSYDKSLWDAAKGLTIALNDIWASEVILEEMKFDGDDYTAKYKVTLWDHFGLDLPDMEKLFNVIPSLGETFVSWFILQHLRGYKPFITKITFTKEFKGTLL